MKRFIIPARVEHTIYTRLKCFVPFVTVCSADDKIKKRSRRHEGDRGPLSQNEDECKRWSAALTLTQTQCFRRRRHDGQKALVETYEREDSGSISL